MDKKDDLVIGAIIGYHYIDIEPWVVSLERSGFSGRKVLLIYGNLADIPEQLHNIKSNIDCIPMPTLQPVQNICVERFGGIWNFLNTNSNDYRFIIATDVKDVIFQNDPSQFMDNYDSSLERIFASSEDITYEHEDWGKKNLISSFGMGVYSRLKDKEIMNAGVIVGTHKIFSDLIWHVANQCLLFQLKNETQYVAGGGGPDQAAYNMQLRLINHYIERTVFMNHSESISCQAGTTKDPTKISKYRQFLKSYEPSWNGSYFIDGGTGKLFTIIHQYDRILEWKKIVDEIYRE